MSTSDSPNPPRDAVDRIEISSPCSVPWEGMPGDEQVRFCGQCRQNVFNIDAISRDEARRLISRQEGRVCVRMLRRPDGTVVTADCWARLGAARRRGIVPWMAALILVLFAEIVAIGSGLSGLRRLMGPPVRTACPTLPNVAVPPTGGTRTEGPAVLKPNPPIAPPARHLMGKMIPPARLMGRVAHKPSK
jgi:hypothetical protein